MNLDKAIRQFKEYAGKYIELNKLCDLKLHHTIRVMEICEQIAKSLSLSEEEIKLAKLCGLLHDIGRFEQWKRFKSFYDAKSIDHGDLGVEILTNDNKKVLRNFIDADQYDEIILNSIKYHNKYKIPTSLSKEEQLFTNIVRDADKIDILYLYTIGEIEINTNNEKMSDKIYQCLINKEEINREHRQTKGDILSISLGFVFDLNYKKSFEILKENNYYDKEINIYIKKNNNKEFINQLENIRVIINEYINKKVEGQI